MKNARLPRVRHGIQPAPAKGWHSVRARTTHTTETQGSEATRTETCALYEVAGLLSESKHGPEMRGA